MKISRIQSQIVQVPADEPLRGFVSVSSSFYPELARYYDEVITRHLDEFSAKIEAEEEAA